MTAGENLQSICESIETLVRRLSLAESMGADTTHLRALLERLRQEASDLGKLLRVNAG